MKEFIVTVNKKGFIVKVSDEGLLKAYAECTEDLIRCKDCNKRYTDDCPMHRGWLVEDDTDDDWFCAEGKRKEG